MKTNPNTATLLNRIRDLLMPLLLCWMTAAAHAAQPRIVFHEIVNPGAGKLVHTYESYPAMSGDGRIVVYSVNRTDGKLDIFAINTDGTGQHALGIWPGDRYRPAICHNGALAALWSGYDLYTLTTASGVPVKVLTMSSPGAIGSIAVNDIGTKVYFIIKADDTILNTTTVLQGGVWEMNPDGSGRRLVKSLNDMRGLVGGDASAWVGSGSSFGQVLSISQNNRLVFTFQPVYATGMNHIMGVNADGTGLHAIGLQVQFPSNATISRDGSRVAYDQYTPHDVHTANWVDGTNHIVQVVPGHGYDPLCLTENGSHLALVDRLLRSDGGTVRSLRSGTSGSILAQGSDAPYLQISADGRKICSVKNFGNTSTLVMIELDPDNLRGAPDITNTAMTPGFVVHNSPGPPPSTPTTTTATAQVTYSGTPNSPYVYANLFLNGLPDPIFYAPVGTLFDDATNGDAVAGNGLFTANNFNFGYSTTSFGPRVVRFVTENTVGGLRHATMVDHEPFFVLAAPPAGSAPAITTVTPNPVAVGGTITITGARFGITRTGNVVTVGGYSCYVLSANSAGTQLTVEVNRYLGNGSYPLVVSANGQSSASVVLNIGTAVPEIAVEQPAGTGIADGGSRDFGSVSTGGNTSLTFTIKNSGNASLTGLTITKDGTNSADFTVTTNPTAPVSGPSGSTTFIVRFAPTTSGAKTAALHIANNDSNENPYDITLTGTGTTVAAPEIAVEQPAGTGIADGGSQNFGSIGTGSNASLTFTIKNTGNASLTGLTITKDGTNSADFTVTTNPAAPVSGPSGSTTFIVRFAPTTSGAKTAALHIANNDSNENPYDITLTGTGTTVAVPDINVTPTSLAFGTVTVGSTLSNNITVANTGGATLNVSAITSNNARYTVVSPTVPFSVAAGGSQVVSIRFAPTTAATENGTLSIVSNDTDENPVNVALGGTGGAVAGVAAVMISPTNGSTLTAAATTFTWSTGTGVASYWLYVGNAAGGNDLYGASEGANRTRTVTLPTDGRVIYVTLWSAINGAWQTNSYTYTCSSATKPVKAQLIAPVNGSTLTTTTPTFTWNAGVGCTEYWLYVGTAVGGSDLYNSNMGTALSRTVTVPATGAKIYVTLWSRINGGWVNSTYLFTTQSPARAVLTGPANGSTLANGNLNLTWSAGTGVTGYWVYVGSTVGGSDLGNYNAGTTRSLNANVPSDGGPIYVTLWSQINGGWQTESYWFNTALPVSGSIAARLTGPANTSTLGSTSVNFTWNAGTGVTQRELWVGSAPDGFDLYKGSNEAGLSRTLNLPGDGRRIYVTLHSLIGPSWVSNAYYFTAVTATQLQAAQITSPVNGQNIATASLALTWSSVAGASSYYLYVGSSPTTADLYTGSQGTSLSRTVTVPTDGRPVYVTLWSQVGGAWLQNNYWFTTPNTVTGNQKAFMTTPNTNGSVLPGATVTFDWTSGVGVTNYALHVGSTPNSSDLYTATSNTIRSRTLTLPTDGRKIYVTLWSVVNGVWQSNSYLYTASNVSPAGAVMTSPAPGTIYTSATVNFAWSAGTGATQYWISVSRTPWGSEIYSGSQGANRNKTLTTMPTDGSPIYVKLQSLINGVWQSSEHIYQAPVL